MPSHRRRTSALAAAAALAAGLSPVAAPLPPASAAPPVTGANASNEPGADSGAGFPYLPAPPLVHIPQYPLTTVAPSAHPVPLAPPRGPALKVHYVYKGKRHTLDDFLKRTSALSLMVLRADAKGRAHLVDQRFFAGETASGYYNSWSVGKSITAAAVGVAVADGRLSLDAPLTRYLPELATSGYAKATVRDLLRMGSGVKWDESNYFNPATGATAAQIRLIFGTPLSSIAEGTPGDRPPGTHWNYNSLDSFVLGWALSRATGMPLARYVQERIWRPAGMASPLYLGRDWAGNGIGYCCYHATTSDFARFGLLFLNRGRAGGRQVVPASWVASSTRVQVPWEAPSRIGQDGWGYGAQWWPGPGSTGDYSAIGLFGQYVYVNPKARVVIVKTSQDLQSESHFGESLPAFRAVAAAASHR